MTPRRSRTTLTPRGLDRAALAGVVCAALALSGCGTRAADGQVAVGAGAGAVTLSPESLRALAELQGGGQPALPPQPGQPAVSDPAVANPKQSPASGAARSKVAKPKPGTVASALPKVAASAVGTCPVALAPVAIGQIGTFSGLLGPATRSMQTTLAAWAQDLNSRGGLACHPIEVHSADDGTDPARAAALAQDMAQNRNVVAFVANALVFPAGFQQAIARAEVPAVGGNGPQSWRNSPWVFPEGASFADQIFGLVRNGVEQGKRRLGLVICVEASACSEFTNDFKATAPVAGAELVYTKQSSITQIDYTAECLNARDAGVDQLAVGLDGASIGRLARSCKAIGYRPLLSSLASLLSPGQAADALVREFGLATSTPTAPWILQDTPGLREYHRVMRQLAPQTPPDAASVTAFTSGKLLEAAIANVAAEVVDAPITPALVLKGLGGIRNESLGGLAAGLTFTPGQKMAASSGCVFLELLTTKGWTAPMGSRPVCRPR
ncbi:MAG: ABC transporter substrate-binding protein [Sporichthyaceae bacterium]